MQQQRGIALITILMMVALATILAATIAKQQRATAHATGSLIQQNQALLYAKSAEAFFSELLVDDANNAAQIDHLQETWAQPMPPFPVDGGVVMGRIEDQNSKFNLNSLLQGDGKSINPAAEAWLQRILQRVDAPIELTQALIDWQDQDDELTGSMGAEGSYYQSLGQGYVAPNAAFHDASSLSQVRGIDAALYQQLKPYVAAYSIEQKVNVNTASAWLLASIDPQLKISDIENLITQRRGQLQHWQDLNEFWQTAPFDQVEPNIRNQMNSMLGVQSNTFISYIEIEFSGYSRYMQSQLQRQDKNIQVMSRSLAPF
ncbi:type II secretion system minor pseudopilin GspK [uncultured Acinetobacter sp.]|uniref:type II secretion system minor pseudopilin GspK n=1 Tax=uncultured Acinetobacter sp. TaxID=165433 RepID=UPI0026156A2F|nr:type II secretion system minor pseudopilin GspK [uncultured Acinetobacter sp.]